MEPFQENLGNQDLENTQGYVAIEQIPSGKKNVYIVLLGTNHIADVWDDISLDLVPLPGGQGNVHEGFLNVWQEMEPQVGNCLNPISNDIENIYVTGHSFGAAVGLLGLASVQAMCPNATLHYYGFAVPRSGDTSFSDFIRDLIPERFVINYAEDLVPCVPSREMGYSHSEPFLVVGENGELIETPDSIHSGSSFETILNAILGPFKTEHAMKTYKALMEGTLNPIPPNDPDAVKVLERTCNVSFCDRCPILRKLKFW